MSGCMGYLLDKPTCTLDVAGNRLRHGENTIFKLLKQHFAHTLVHLPKNKAHLFSFQFCLQASELLLIFFFLSRVVRQSLLVMCLSTLLERILHLVLYSYPRKSWLCYVMTQNKLNFYDCIFGHTQHVSSKECETARVCS